jgi:hypothetical protein
MTKPHLETLDAPADRLEFDRLHEGDQLQIVTGQGDEAWNYSFLVKNTEARWPVGSLSAINPDGTAEPYIGFALHGCVRHTTRSQNPVQTQRTALTPYYDGLVIGNFMWGKFEGEDDRAVFDKAGQEISQITRNPYRENAIIDLLGSHVGANTVRLMAYYIINENLPKITEKDIRQTARDLAELGIVKVEARKGKAVRFALAANE